MILELFENVPVEEDEIVFENIVLAPALVNCMCPGWCRVNVVKLDKFRYFFENGWLTFSLHEMPSVDMIYILGIT